MKVFSAIAVLLDLFCQARAARTDAHSRVLQSRHLSDGSLPVSDKAFHPITQEFMRQLERNSTPTLKRGRLSLLQREAERQPHGKVLYVVWSGSNFYGTRLAWIANTWAKHVTHSSLVVVGDSEASPGFPLDVLPTTCPPHTHWEGMCCKWAAGVIQANSMLQSDTTFEWAYFMDDDVYVRPSQLEMALEQQAPNSSHTAVSLGRFGCETKLCKTGGICGGSGYALNRLALKQLVGESAIDFVRAQMTSCGTCERWADVSLGQVIASRKIEERRLFGAYGWPMTKAGFDQSLNDTSSEPFLYHYMRSGSQMKFLHDLFAQQAHSTASTQSSGLGLCSTYHSNQVCAASDRPEDRPWADAASAKWLFSTGAYNKTAVAQNQTANQR